MEFQGEWWSLGCQAFGRTQWNGKVSADGPTTNSMHRRMKQTFSLKKTVDEEPNGQLERAGATIEVKTEEAEISKGSQGKCSSSHHPPSHSHSLALCYANH